MGEKITKIFFDVLYAIMPTGIIVITGLIFYFNYNDQFLENLMSFIFPVLFYVICLLICFYYRRHKKKKIIAENGSQEIYIVINYFSLFWHDMLLFLTPCIIIILAYWVKGQVDIIDIVSSAIAAIALYLSELIYKNKRTNL